MERVNQKIMTAVIASESIHIFCCVLPTIFSVMSLLAGAGMMATMPTFMSAAHDTIHAYEIPMIIASAVILAAGWGLYAYSRKISCRTEGTCSHQPCAPKKDRTRAIMIVATMLFLVNVSVYFALHRTHNTALVTTYEIHHNHGHEHDTHNH